MTITQSEFSQKKQKFTFVKLQVEKLLIDKDVPRDVIVEIKKLHDFLVHMILRNIIKHLKSN